MSLYRFKSRETGDLVMLQPHGQRILEIIGKDPKGPGILRPGEMPGAVAALREAVRAEEELQQRLKDDSSESASESEIFDFVNLRVRSTPFIEMLQRCEKAEVDVVWGV